MLRNICVFILYILLSFQAFLCRGQIKDAKTGEPLIGATILLKNTNLNLSAAAGLDGSFQIKNIPSGEYQLQVSYIAYKISITKVKVENQDVIVNIFLEENSQ